ncbi:MAG: penicillin acylase family protein, partial [Deltaproteobacteria bacterium]|nr:penicillin acylase family protein [Nannocystaceae bacterium]
MSDRRLIATLPLLALVAACSSSEADHRWRAEIRWTSFGIPHITADDVPSAAYAQGYAFAQDAGCILADQIVKVRSERAAFFGPGDADANLDSDFTLLHLGIYQRAQGAFPEQPEDIQELVLSYASGYNAYLEAHGEDMPCGGEPWLRAIDEIDLFAHYIELGTLASARALAGYIATAQPPGAGLVRDDDPMPLSRLR